MAVKGDPKVIEFLNEALKNELTAINQYWLHYRLFDHWGVYKLAEFERQVRSNVNLKQAFANLVAQWSERTAPRAAGAARGR